MRTIVEPKEHINKLWGEQRIREEAIYRLMKYVLRVDHEDKVLLHNVVTGRLVVLNETEAEMLNGLPTAYRPVMEQLVTDHYLVPEDYDEHQQVVNLRSILWMLTDAHSSKDIVYYTILPTTACNARCWYCYEKGIRPITMTEETAEQVVDFITRKCGGKPVKIRWFGGEPTIATSRIDYISQGLRDRSVTYSSVVTSNGYLFDEDMVIKAKELWNTTQVSISIDGIEETYNRIKAFNEVLDNPYRRMMNNIELLLRHGINVVLRMNFDKTTWSDFPKLLKEVKDRFQNDPHLMVYPHQINRDMPPNEWAKMEKWLNRKNAELRNLAKAFGNYHRESELPNLMFLMCEAGSDSSVTIRPDGLLVSCPEQLGDEQVKGDVSRGVTNKGIVSNWKRFADHKRCWDCALFADCIRLINCNSQARCSNKVGRLEEIRNKIVSCYANANG